MITPKPTEAVPGLASNPSLEAAWKWILTLAAATVLGLVATTLDTGAYPYIPFAFAGAFVMHLAMRPPRSDVIAAMASGIGFAAIYLLYRGATVPYFGRLAGIPGGFLGMGSLAILAWQCIWAPPLQRWTRFERLREAALIPLLCVISVITVTGVAVLTPITYDRVLYAFDTKFGGPPSWVAGRFFRQHEWIQIACGSVYNSLPLGMAVCLAIQWRDRQWKKRLIADLRWVAMALGSVGFLLYHVCPAAGPLYLFRNEFPFHVPDLTGVAIQPAWLEVAPRNGMPSLHVGWTLLLFWNMRRNGWWIRIATAVYMIVTAVATLGSGEHYLVDLMVAPPVALVIQALCTGTRHKMRWIALGVGAAITLAWLIGFRTSAALAIPGGAAAWTLGILSLAIPAVFAWRLDRSAATG